eukprot:6480856-Amphidinium_carterae.1
MESCLDPDWSSRPHRAEWQRAYTPSGAVSRSPVCARAAHAGGDLEEVCWDIKRVGGGDAEETQGERRSKRSSPAPDASLRPRPGKQPCDATWKSALADFTAARKRMTHLSDVELDIHLVELATQG